MRAMMLNRARAGSNAIMIRPATTFNSNNPAATDVLKLLKALSQPPAPPPPRSNVVGTTPLIGTGPLGAIKDPTANSVMSIVQLGQSQSEAERSLGQEPEDDAGNASERAYIQTIVQEYAANNAEAADASGEEAKPETNQATVAAEHEDANTIATLPQATNQPLQQVALTSQPLLFIPNVAYLQQSLGKNRPRAKKLRASWRFAFRKNDDLAE
jgi:hypothetical protein